MPTFPKDLGKIFQKIIKIHPKRKACPSALGLIWICFFRKIHVSKSSVCSHSKNFHKHLLLFKFLDFHGMNCSHLTVWGTMLPAKPSPTRTPKHAHTSIWVRFLNPHGDTSQMLVKGEMLTFVGSKPLLQSKHRLLYLKPPSTASPQLLLAVKQPPLAGRGEQKWKQSVLQALSQQISALRP